MIYRSPFYAVGKALYAALSEVDSNVPWFESSVPPEEIETLLKNRGQYCYGIIGAATADVNSNKDTAYWEVATNLEIYSNYKGSKVVAQKTEGILNYLCDASKTKLQEKLHDEGFGLISIQCGSMTINSPVFSDSATWISGGMQLKLLIQQI